ncbi:M15 family metallopeptidase [Nocardioides jejuensis]|uniref:M15 family peptidase n=1 Tax=Nocardioides jejuensis TaxID=2502782 RepID=A0A4R1BY79_9ACTN|nr:M15 family metallopeptidase [Nocardioides jejuensis]TCJ23013.1 M15 family peptidase [Nocardioides jejuensis]
MTALCQNGHPALPPDSPLLHDWAIPTRDGVVHLKMHSGSAGFLLAHYALWYADNIEPLVGKVLDDWAYAYRMVRGSETDLSNHSGGYAIDLNATQHNLGDDPAKSFTPQEIAAITKRLEIYEGALRWGGAFTGRKDSMHTECIGTTTEWERVARKYTTSPRGKRILKANPGQKKVIFS